MGGIFHKLRHPRRCYLVCAVTRSGSNLLTEGLHATRVAGRPKQFFLPKFEQEYGPKHKLDPSDFAAYVRGVIENTTTSNEVFGFKIMGWYLREFLTRLRKTEAFGGRRSSEIQLLENAFPKISFVQIVRRNKVRQAVLKAEALQLASKSTDAPAFNEELITRCLRETESDEAVWARFFEINGVTRHRVEYEDLVASYQPTMAAVLDFLQIKNPQNLEMPDPLPRRKPDPVSHEWEERYTQLHPSTKIPLTA